MGRHVIDPYTIFLTLRYNKFRIKSRFSPKKILTPKIKRVLSNFLNGSIIGTFPLSTRHISTKSYFFSIISQEFAHPSSSQQLYKELYGFYFRIY